MYMKKQERKEKKKNFQLCRLPWQSAKLGTTACKTRFADRLPGSRQSLCRLPGEKQSGKPFSTARRKAVGADCFSPGSREILCRLLFSWQSGKPLPTARKAVGKGDGTGRRRSLYRLVIRPSGKPLPTAVRKAVGKEFFPDIFSPGTPLPTA